jgi:hypothetical protein
MDKTSGGSVTRTVIYYPTRSAMRINNTLYYILKDHLGSASVVTDSSGTVVGEQRYYPYGETRFTSGTIYTDKLFTGQRDVGLGIFAALTLERLTRQWKATPFLHPIVIPYSAYSHPVLIPY